MSNTNIGSLCLFWRKHVTLTLVHTVYFDVTISHTNTGSYCLLWPFAGQWRNTWSMASQWLQSNTTRSPSTSVTLWDSQSCPHRAPPCKYVTYSFLFITHSFHFIAYSFLFISQAFHFIAYSFLFIAYTMFMTHSFQFIAYSFLFISQLFQYIAYTFMFMTYSFQFIAYSFLFITQPFQFICWNRCANCRCNSLLTYSTSSGFFKIIFCCLYSMSFLF